MDVFVVRVFEGIGPFHLSYQILGKELFTGFLYLPFNVREIRNDGFSFISDISNLHLLPYFLGLDQLEVFHFSDLFKETIFGFIGFSLLFSSFQLSLISALIFIIYLFVCLLQGSIDLFSPVF